MRGSPVLRFILLALALAATAAGLQRLTSSKVEAEPVTTTGKSVALPAAVPFRLMLSAPAKVVVIEAGTTVRPALDEMPVSGTLEMDAENPHVALVVRWKNPTTTGEHRFAKLTLEPPGQETFVHVFDADGDVDDFIELPFPVAK